jgi:hypothetical protein
MCSFTDGVAGIARDSTRLREETKLVSTTRLEHRLVVPVCVNNVWILHVEMRAWRTRKITSARNGAVCVAGIWNHSSQSWFNKFNVEFQYLEISKSWHQSMTVFIVKSYLPILVNNVWCTGNICYGYLRACTRLTPYFFLILLCCHYFHDLMITTFDAYDLYDSLFPYASPNTIAVLRRCRDVQLLILAWSTITDGSAIQVRLRIAAPK